MMWEKKLGLDAPQTDDIVKQLSEIGMIKEMVDYKIILTQEALAVIDRTDKQLEP
jgi:hypothetical protein